MIRRAIVQKTRAMAVSALILGLPGCVSTVVATPPGALLEDCPKPSIAGDTNLALAQAYNARGRAIDNCNVDKASLRAWFAEANK